MEFILHSKWAEQPATAVVIISAGGKVSIGISLVSKKDHFNKKKGVNIARWRAEYMPRYYFKITDCGENISAYSLIKVFITDLFTDIVFNKKKLRLLKQELYKDRLAHEIALAVMEDTPPCT